MAKQTNKSKQSQSSKAGNNCKKVGSVTEVTKSRHIADSVRCMLWGKAAGRCEFSGCNKILWKSSVTQEQVNIAEAAHIYAFSTEGPRGNQGIDINRLNDIDNLMLACHDCHRTIDQNQDGGRYTIEILQQWKRVHENRIEIVAGVDPSKNSHVILYGANIGNHDSPLNFADAANALFPNNYYPAEQRPIALGIINSAFQDDNSDYWNIQAENLKLQFRQKIKERIENGNISHLSIFALAPQPLLILLGTLLIDITSADVYQRHREPLQTWNWPDKSTPLDFRVIRPESYAGPPALVLALTADVSPDRIVSVVGSEAKIWTVTIPNPNNDHIKGKVDLSNFRKIIRGVMNEISTHHGQTTPLHIFPAAAVSVAIELGRVRMPKAQMPWIIYDHNNKHKGFREALRIV